MYGETSFEYPEFDKPSFDGSDRTEDPEIVFEFVDDGCPEEYDAFPDVPEGDDNPSSVESSEGLDDVGALIPGALRRSQLSGNHTQFFDIEGRPDLVVRQNWRTSPDQVPGLLDGLDSTKVLSREEGVEKGINVLPFEPVEYDGQLYVVTKRVDGITLDRALHAQPEKLRAEVDKVLSRVCNSLLTCFLSGESFPADVTECRQYMHGTIQGDAEPEVWLVDLPFAGMPAAEMGVFEAVLGDIVLEVQNMERWGGGQPLPGARAAITRALPLCRNEALRYLPALEQYIRDRGAAASGDADAVVMWRGY